jgi:integrase
VPHLPLPEVAVDALRRLRAMQAAERLAAGGAYGTCPECAGSHVVADELGMPVRPQWYSDLFDRLAKRAGLPRVVLHGARHTAASLLADLGVPDVAAAAWLGHTKVDVTRGYQHVQAQRLAQASEVLGAALSGEAM